MVGIFLNKLKSMEIDVNTKVKKLSINKITRFEYITDKGRQVVEYGEFEFQLQDDNRTLKVFKK